MIGATSFEQREEAISSMDDLFAGGDAACASREKIADGAILLRGRALADEDALQAAVATISAESPFRNMTTPGGFTMSVAMTNCGRVGWVTDRFGYRYTSEDPATGKPWPEMPAALCRLATEAAMEAGYASFDPDACLINNYEPGARLSLHQDRNELDLDQPIVSVSLGLPATFQFGGLERDAPVRRHVLRHGDVVVWGGPSRLCFHGVLRLADGLHERLGRRRINLTFRKALAR